MYTQRLVEENDEAEEISNHINLQGWNSDHFTGFVDRFSLSPNLNLDEPLKLNLAKSLTLNLAKPQRMTHERHCLRDGK